MASPVYQNIKIDKKDSEIEIIGEISVEAIVEYRKKALREIGMTVEVPGFRKGHIPEKALVDRFGEVAILDEAASIALKEITPEIVEKNAPDYIGQPTIAITKLAPGNPISFKINVTTVPDFALPDYKKIAKNELGRPETAEEKIEITDKEVDAVILEVRKQAAHQAFHEANKDNKEHNHADIDIEKFMPEFNDGFVKSIGNFTDVADFKMKAKENLRKEKEHRQMEKRRGKLLEMLVEKTDIKIPQILVDSELDRTMSQFEGDIKNLGMKIEDYLKHIKKTPQDLRKEWLPDAEKRAKLNLILEKIAKVENIVADQEIVDHEVMHLKEQYKDVDELRIRLYVEHTLTIEKVIQFLEKQK